MPTYNITIEVEVIADSQEKAWELVARPFHDGSMAHIQPEWLKPLVSEPELVKGWG